jgi:hypothetical protein
MYASNLLAEMAIGHFACAFRVEPKDAAQNAQMVASWAALAERTKDTAQFWSGQRSLDPKAARSSANPLGFASGRPPRSDPTGRLSTSKHFHHRLLAVGWDKTPARTQLNVNVWQITIDGKAPKQPGGSDDAVEITK